MIAVRDVEDGPTTLSMAVAPPAGLTRLGDFRLLSEGLVGVRDLSYREHEAVGVDPGWATVTVWGDAEREPSEIVVQVVGLALPLQLDRLGEGAPYALGVGAAELDHHLLVRLHGRRHGERPGMVVQEPLAGVEVGPHQHAVLVELPRDQAVADVPPGPVGRALLPDVVVLGQQRPSRPRSACRHPAARASRRLDRRCAAQELTPRRARTHTSAGG